MSDLTIDDESVITKIKILIDRNDPKLLNHLKNFKTANDSFSMLHHAAKNYRPRICEIFIDGSNIGDWNFEGLSHL